MKTNRIKICCQKLFAMHQTQFNQFKKNYLNIYPLQSFNATKLFGIFSARHRVEWMNATSIETKAVFKWSIQHNNREFKSNSYTEKFQIKIYECTMNTILNWNNSNRMCSCQTQMAYNMKSNETWYPGRKLFCIFEAPKISFIFY